jgi:mono/diheme cytochrome c family protein
VPDSSAKWLVVVLTLSVAAHGQDAPGDAAKGKALYRPLCGSCHGDKGLGNGPAAASLNPRPASFKAPEVAARLTSDAVYRLLKEGGPDAGLSPLMAPFAETLSEAQLRDVTAYVLTLAPPAR